jgi:SAM-dependent methyltransferase
MGRFETTVPLYAELRTPYPDEFFATVAAKLGFSKQAALIDLGTGPGLLALGFAPYVGRITGVDPETAMLAVARQATERQRQKFTLIEGKAETLPDDIGRFDVITIGRALHWMDRDTMAALLPRLVTPDGAIVVCASGSAPDGRNTWLATYNEARHVWSGDRAGSRHRGALTALLAGTPLKQTEEIFVESTHEVGISDLARRVLTFSSSSPAILGDKAEAMLADVPERLLPFSRDGMVSEVVVSTARVARVAS